MNDLDGDQSITISGTDDSGSQLEKTVTWGADNIRPERAEFPTHGTFPHNAALARRRWFLRYVFGIPLLAMTFSSDCSFHKKSYNTNKMRNTFFFNLYIYICGQYANNKKNRY